MKNFDYVNGKLTCRGFDLADLAKTYGTPLWVYDGDQIKRNFCAIRQAFSGLQAEIRYAVKANDCSKVLLLLEDLGSGFDVVSGGELHRVLRTEVDPSKIVFAGAAKTKEEVEQALLAQVGWMNVESTCELNRIISYARKLSIEPKVALRVAPAIMTHTDAHISTAHEETKFGMELDQIERILANQTKYDCIYIAGIHCHVGSQIRDPQVYADALDKILPLFKRYNNLYSLDLGGGFPVNYNAPGEQELVSIKNYVEIIGNKIADSNLGHKIQLIIEPGRAIVADAGVLLVEVQSTKMSGKKYIVTCDGGMADLVRPAMYPDCFHEILPLRMSYDHILSEIAGPHCESSDFLGKNRLMNSDLAEDEILAIMTAGAYGRTMSSNYNGSRFAAEVIIKAGKCILARERQTYEQLMMNEIW